MGKKFGVVNLDEKKGVKEEMEVHTEVPKNQFGSVEPNASSVITVEKDVTPTKDAAPIYNDYDIDEDAVEITKEKKEETKPFVNKFEGGAKMENVVKKAKVADIINLTINVGLRDIEDFMRDVLSVDFGLSIQEFNPSRELDRFPENEKADIQAVFEKIVAYANDGTYLNIVPVLTVDSNLLKSPINDMNLIALGIRQNKPSLDKISSRYCVQHIVERTGGHSDVYLDTATVIVEVATNLLNNCIAKEAVLASNSQYEVGITFNGRDGYTVEFANKNFRATK